MKKTEKKHRLDKNNYLGFQSVSFTGCVFDMNNLFINDMMFEIVQKYLLKEAEYCKIDLIVYLFMPDHFHLITCGNTPESDPLDFMKRFKQDTGYWFSQNKIGEKWQKDFYDHIIRNDEDIKNQVCYILNNPVRKGLVSDWKDYPYKGSTIYDLNHFII